jgi:GT2 family glycosyltransferase
MDHDDLIPPHALHCVADAINENPHIRMIYSDEDKINRYGKREDPHFKTDWNLELFRSYNMFSHLGVYHRSLIEKTGGFRTDFNGAQDYDLALRCIELIDRTQIHHIPRVLYHWRAIEGSTALSGDEKPYAAIAGQKALNEHFERIAVKAVSELLPYGWYRTLYELGPNPPAVSIIIPTRNAKDLVKQCIDSVIAKTSYNNFEILLIDNNSDDPESVAYFKSLATDRRITIIRDDRPFNYSALNNNAVSYCKGEVIVLLNNDTEVISPDWIETMVGHALQPGNGAIGAKLLFPDSRVQHAGVVVGVGGIAGHSHKYFPRNDPGYVGRAVVCSEFSAVTGACLMVRKELYLAVGGLNEVDLEIAYNDVDFCLRLREAGFRNVFTPFAELFHHESATRGQDVSERSERERDYMRNRWGDIIAADPAYSPNLTLVVEDFSFASPPRLAKP